MQKALCPEAANIAVPRLDELKQLVDSTCMCGWVLRVEHSPAVELTNCDWRQWGESGFAASMGSSLLDSINACYSAHPNHIIRLHAEKVSPQTKFIYWVYRPDEPRAQALLSVEDTSRAITGDIRKYLAPFYDRTHVARQKLWQIIAIAGMLMASLFVIEEVVAT